MKFKEMICNRKLCATIMIATIVILIAIVYNMHQQNTHLKSMLGGNYHYAVANVLISPPRDLRRELQENKNLSAEYMEYYAVKFSSLFHSLQRYYPGNTRIPELHDYSWQLYLKTQEVADNLKNNVYDEIPLDVRAELIKMIEHGERTFYELDKVIVEDKLFKTNRWGVKWYNALHQPSDKIKDIFSEGLAPVITIKE